MNNSIGQGQTSQQWYASDDSCDILDAYGWRDLSDPGNFWFYHPISKLEYEQRRMTCTIAPYMRLEHLPPFEINEGFNHMPDNRLRDVLLVFFAIVGFIFALYVLDIFYREFFGSGSGRRR